MARAFLRAKKPGRFGRPSRVWVLFRDHQVFLFGSLQSFVVGNHADGAVFCHVFQGLAPGEQVFLGGGEDLLAFLADDLFGFRLRLLLLLWQQLFGEPS